MSWLQKIVAGIKQKIPIPPGPALTAAVDMETTAQEQQLEKIQKKLIQERFQQDGYRRKVASVHVKDASEQAVRMSADPVRFYKDGVISAEESATLIGGFENAIVRMSLDEGNKGEAMINPLDPYSEEILGPQIPAIAALCYERGRQLLLSQCNLQDRDIEVAGALLTRLQYPTSISGCDDCLKNILSTYATPHIDKANRIKYDYSTVLYLNDSGEWLNFMTNSHNMNRNSDDRHSAPRGFEGGRFLFNDAEGCDVAVVPRRGRLLLFGSGPENLHRVQHVQRGKRYTLGIWYSRRNGS